MEALNTIVKSGKALYAGISNYDGPTMARAVEILEELKCPFVINQNRYSIFDRTIELNGLKKTAKRMRKGIIAFSPLRQGTHMFLTSGTGNADRPLSERYSGKQPYSR